MFFSQRDGLSMLDVVCITITMSAITYSVYVFRIIALVNDYTLAQIIELEREEMNNERRLSQLSERLASLQARRSGVRSSGYLTSEETFYQNELARLSAELEVVLLRMLGSFFRLSVIYLFSLLFLYFTCDYCVFPAFLFGLDMIGKIEYRNPIKTRFVWDTRCAHYWELCEIGICPIY